MLHKSLLIYSILSLFLVLLSACEESEQYSSERIVFNVSAGEGQAGFSSNQTDRYIISTNDSAFFDINISNTVQDSLFNPERLNIIIILTGDLIPSLLYKPNGYSVSTQFQLKGGIIQVSHTNQASMIASPEGDTLYAIRGEGMVSSGTDAFKNISGLFYEESTYKISPDTAGLSPDKKMVTQIDCRYELIIDF